MRMTAFLVLKLHFKKFNNWNYI